MYKKFPGADKMIAPPAPADAPASILTAIRLMYVGAAVTTVTTVVSLIGLSGVKTELHNANHKLTTTQINQYYEYLVFTTVIFGLIGVALWLAMARGTTQARRWSQIISTILFVIYTLAEMLPTIFGTRVILAAVLAGLPWLVGAATVFYLWKPESKVYFNPV